MVAILLISVLTVIAFYVGNSYLNNTRATQSIVAIKSSINTEDLIGKMIYGKRYYDSLIVGTKQGVNSDTSVRLLDNNPWEASLLGKDYYSVVLVDSNQNAGVGTFAQSRIDGGNAAEYIKGLTTSSGSTTADVIQSFDKYIITGTPFSSPPLELFIWEVET